MRRLIRPALLLMVRLGLFLSIVSWLVSQTYLVMGVIPLDSHHLRSIAAPAGWMFIVWPSADRFEFKTLNVSGRKSSDELWFFDAIFYSRSETGYPLDDHHAGPGFTYGRAEAIAPYLTIRHSLVVAIFGVLYLLLTRVCRHRPDADRSERSGES